jgi:hypothetical protein
MRLILPFAALTTALTTTSLTAATTAAAATETPAYNTASASPTAVATSTKFPSFNGSYYEPTHNETYPSYNGTYQAYNGTDKPIMDFFLLDSMLMHTVEMLEQVSPTSLMHIGLCVHERHAAGRLRGALWHGQRIPL